MQLASDDAAKPLPTQRPPEFPRAGVEFVPESTLEFLPIARWSNQWRCSQGRSHSQADDRANVNKIRPWRCLIIDRCTACTKLNAPFRFVFNTTSQSSGDMAMLSMSRVTP